MKSSLRSPPVAGARPSGGGRTRISRDRLNARTAAFPIVGIGASAGGLEAFTLLLKRLPARSGMAFILVQHLDPNHESMTAEILARSTRMPVTEVKDGMRAEPDHIYVIPPNHAMSISGGVLRLSPRVETRGTYMTIDIFLQSLAEDQSNKAIGVVLSGTGSDGTTGVGAIKVAGGITFAQDPESAKFDGMPTSAIHSGNIDFVLRPQEIAQELVGLARHPYVTLAEKSRTTDRQEELNDAGKIPEALFNILKRQTGVDFERYKRSTLKRRIARRMVVQKTKTFADYVGFIQEHPQEVDALYADILIHVTRFFRDPEGFKALKSHAFPQLMKNRQRGAPLRLWVPGCSTGEEVYSLAMTVLEFLGDRSSDTPLQIFATDISEQSLQKARAGAYPESIKQDVSQERLERFFVKTEEGYKIRKEVRDLCLFSKHDLTGDPPFAKLDLISCHNLLIYFSGSLQKKLIPLFHYALNPGSFLWLGRSESVSGFSNLFETFDKDNKIYVRKPGRTDTLFQYSLSPGPEGQGRSKSPSRPVSAGFDLQKEVDRAILKESVPPGVVINDRAEILEFRGRIVPFLEPASGEASHSLFRMAHPSIVGDLRVLIQSVRKQNASVTKDSVELLDDLRRLWTFDLKAIPIAAPAPSEERFFLILFEHVAVTETPKRGARRGGATSRPTAALQKRVALLERELAESTRHQESLVKDYETAHEELAATNEEFQSTNEELQTTNEELETAKEELQSTNEELTTVNDEVQSRNTELNQLNNDLINLLSSVEIPILMIGNDGRIRRFTPKAAEALNLIPGDVGRPFSDIKSNFTALGFGFDLDQMISDVTERGSPKEVEVQDQKGRWYRLQVKPYRTVENRLDGVVIAFIDIDLLKRILKEVTVARADAESANRAKDLFLATLSHELRTPLTGILSWAQMLRMGRLDEVKAKRAAEMIEESARAQAQLINDLLDVSRIVMGKLALDLKEVHPGVVVRAAIESVRPLAEAKGIRIDSQLGPDVGTIMADSARLHQVFSNLLTNSVKFSPPESTIRIRMENIASDAGRKAGFKFQVIDSGKGISPEFLPHVFDRFTQDDNSSTRALGGLGLGLAIVRNLVELHGGGIEAESAGIGKGATFTIFLPLSSERKTEGTRRKEKAIENQQVQMHQTRLDGLRILLVDDEVVAREAFTEILRSYGAEVKPVASAREALELLAGFKPHLLLSDIAMPEEDGYSLISKVRALPPEMGGKVLAIALTAHAGPEDVERALSGGFQSQIAKPVDSDYLASVIASVVGQTHSC